jgi:hypothetical protein
MSPPIWAGSSVLGRIRPWDQARMRDPYFTFRVFAALFDRVPDPIAVATNR